MTADSILVQPYPSDVVPLRRSPLADRADELAAGSSPAVRLAELPFATQLILRLDPDGAAAARVSGVLGCALPGPGRATGSGVGSALWLGPQEWLVIAPDGDRGALIAQLSAAVGDGRGGVVDVSASRTAVSLEGPAAREVLAKGVTCDLHPRAFGPGCVVATTLARTTLVVWQQDEAPGYRLLVAASFAHYLADWLLDACLEFTHGDPDPVVGPCP